MILVPEKVNMLKDVLFILFSTRCIYDAELLVASPHGKLWNIQKTNSFFWGGSQAFSEINQSVSADLT